MLPLGWGLWDSIIIGSCKTRKEAEQVIRRTTMRPSRTLAFACAIGLALSAIPAQALMLDFIGTATPTGERREVLTSYRLPIGPSLLDERLEAPEELREIMLHATVYCGFPTAIDAFRSVTEVVQAQG
mgnify:CR=1 FL=1